MSPIPLTDTCFDYQIRKVHKFELNMPYVINAIQNSFMYLAFMHGEPMSCYDRTGELGALTDTPHSLNEMIFTWRKNEPTSCRDTSEWIVCVETTHDLREMVFMWKHRTENLFMQKRACVSNLSVQSERGGIQVFRVDFTVDEYHTSGYFQTPYGKLDICCDIDRSSRIDGRRLSYLALQRNVGIRILEDKLASDLNSIMFGNVEDMPKRCARFVQEHKDLLSSYMVGVIHDL